MQVKVLCDSILRGVSPILNRNDKSTRKTPGSLTVHMETVNKANGWQLQVESADSVYEAIKLKSKVCFIMTILSEMSTLWVAWLKVGTCSSAVELRIHDPKWVWTPCGLGVVSLSKTLYSNLFLSTQVYKWVLA